MNKNIELNMRIIYYRHGNIPRICGILRMHILIDLFLSFPHNLEFLFYGHFVAVKCLIMVIEQKFLGIHHFWLSGPYYYEHFISAEK